MKKMIVAVLVGAVFAAVLPRAAFAAPMDMSGMDHKDMAGCRETCDATITRQKPPSEKHCALCFERQSSRENKALVFETKKPVPHHALTEKQNIAPIHGREINGTRHDHGHFKNRSQTDFLKSIRKRE